jgi:DNA-binding transcriptional LysR family regulator
MDSAADISLFLRVFDSGSISAAARSLDLSVAVASQRLKRLEAHLGVRLFHRTTRQLRPTTEGLLLAEQGRALVQDLEALTTSLRAAGTGVAGLLRVTTSATFGRQYLSPLLPEFLARHPRLQISVNLDDQRHDLVAEGYDVSIRIGALDDSSLVARRLASNRRVLCASPDYLRRQGAPRTPEDLRQHQCLLLSSRRGRGDLWLLTDAQGVEHGVRVQGRIDCNTGELLRDAAVAGLGIALHSIWHIHEDLRAGRLQIVLPDCRLPDTGIHALMPQRRLMPPRVRAFVDFMAEQLGDTPPWERAPLTPGA